MYLVVRTHSHTDNQQLLKVMSRPHKSLDSCVAWKDFCEREYNTPKSKRKHKFFIVRIVELPDQVQIKDNPTTSHKQK